MPPLLPQPRKEMRNWGAGQGGGVPPTRGREGESCNGLQGFLLFLRFPYPCSQLTAVPAVSPQYPSSRPPLRVGGQRTEGAERGPGNPPSPGMYVRREPRLPASAWPTLCDLRQRHVPLWCPESSTPSPSSPAPIIESQLRKESEAHSHCACVTHRALSEGLPGVGSLAHFAPGTETGKDSSRNESPGRCGEQALQVGDRRP